MGEINLNPEVSGRNEVPVKSQEEIRREREHELAKINLGVVFKTCNTGESRVQFLTARVKELTQKFGVEDVFSEKLEVCAGIQNKKEFIDTAFNLLRPVFELMINDPENTAPEEEDKKFIQINDLLSYGFGREKIHIHATPEKKVENPLAAIMDGLGKLAEVVEERKDVKLITATSWIVAKHPKVMERLGFTLSGKISKKDREAYFAGDEREIHRAHMTREDFLAKYLNK